MSEIEYNWHYYAQRPLDQDPHRDRHDAARELHENSLFSPNLFWGSFREYLNLSVNDILTSDNSLIRAFGMLDARVGKRRLKTIDVSGEHDLVARLFHLRCHAEGLVGPDEPIDLTSRLVTPPRSGTYADAIAERRPEAIRKLADSNRMRNFATLVARIRNNELAEDQLPTDIAKAVYRGFQNAPEPDVLLQTLQFLESKTKLCGDITYLKAVIATTADHAHWLRPLEEWKPATHNRHRQFASLARHLWARYDVPAFMDNVWLRGTANQQQWYKDIGKGRNIRDCDNLPFPLTRKMAHYFLTAPDHYSVRAALRWGQVHALGGDQRLADALRGTPLAEDCHDNDFSLSLIRFFSRHPMLDTAHIGPIIDYIWNQRFRNRIVFVARGVPEERDPPQPNFSMRGRTVEALLRAVERWHGRLGEESKCENLQWPASRIGEFSFVEGSEQNNNLKTWSITELLTGRELIEEGKKMHHCVASYADSCHRGKCSIWSMQRETDEGTESLLTIEVNHADARIRQIRGKHNRLPTETEKAVINRWASREKLEYPSYLL